VKPTRAHHVLPDGADKGIIPLTCSELFTRLATQRAADPNVNFVVEVSYIEVSFCGISTGIPLMSCDRFIMKKFVIC
jgi:hypothetical protein